MNFQRRRESFASTAAVFLFKCTLQQSDRHPSTHPPIGQQIYTFCILPRRMDRHDSAARPAVRSFFSFRLALTRTRIRIKFDVMQRGNEAWINKLRPAHSDNWMDCRKSESFFHSRSLPAALSRPRRLCWRPRTPLTEWTKAKFMRPATRECENRIFDEQATDLCRRQQQPFDADEILNWKCAPLSIYTKKRRRDEESTESFGCWQIDVAFHLRLFAFAMQF